MGTIISKKAVRTYKYDFVFQKDLLYKISEYSNIQSIYNLCNTNSKGRIVIDKLYLSYLKIYKKICNIINNFQKIKRGVSVFTPLNFLYINISTTEIFLSMFKYDPIKANFIDYQENYLLAKFEGENINIINKPISIIIEKFYGSVTSVIFPNYKYKTTIHNNEDLKQEIIEDFGEVSYHRIYKDVHNNVNKMLSTIYFSTIINKTNIDTYDDKFISKLFLNSVTSFCNNLSLFNG